MDSSKKELKIKREARESKSHRRRLRSPNKKSGKRDKKDSRSYRKLSRSPQDGSRSHRKRQRSPEKESRSDQQESRSHRKRQRSPEKGPRSDQEESRSHRKRSRSPIAKHENDEKESKPHRIQSKSQNSYSKDISVENRILTHSDQSVGAGEPSISIEETNKLRTKIGLKPLDVDNDPFKPKTNKDFVHVPAENLKTKRMTEILREKITVTREKRKILDSLKTVKTLGESDSDGDGDASDWVLRNKKIQEEKQKAEKRMMLIEEMDESVEKSNDISYTSRNLKGMIIEHEKERFTNGDIVVLTLKDKNVLADDRDILINVNIIDKEKAEKNVESRKRKADYVAYEEEFDQFGNYLPKKPLLNKYDEEINGANKDSFQLGSGGNVNLKKERKLQEIQKQFNKKEESLVLPSPVVQSDYLSKDVEKVKFKKPKKSIRVRKPKSLRADQLTDFDQPGKSKSDFGSRNVNKQDPIESVNCNIGIDLFKREEPDLSDPEPEDLTGVVLEPDQAEFELESALNRYRKLKQKPETGLLEIKNVVANIKLHSLNKMDDDLESKGIVIDPSSEFCRVLGDLPTYGLSGNRDEKDSNDLMNRESDLTDNEEKNLIELDDVKDRKNNGGWNEVDVNETKLEMTTPNEVYEPILEKEPDLSYGIAGALKFAIDKGYIEKSVNKLAVASKRSHLEAENYSIEDKSGFDDDKHSRRNRYYSTGPTSDFKEKEGYNPDVKLEYTDDNGRVLCAKEAFRLMSHKFHGKGSGKKKTEKRMKKVQEEAAIAQMSLVDTPLNTLTLLKEKQKKTQSAFIVLSGSKSLNPHSISKAM